MQYVEGQELKHVSDLDLVTTVEGISTFKTVVEYREKKTGLLHSRRFDDSAQASLFVDEHRAHAKMDSEGNAIPHQWVRLSDWDWFAFRPAWFAGAKVTART